MKQTKLLEVDAYIYGEHIGTLAYYEGKIYFSYNKAFLTKSIEISPLKLPTDKTLALYTHSDATLYQGMAGVFFDSLPDAFGMSFIDRYFESQGYKSTEITLLDRLSFIGDRGMGAIEYRPKLSTANNETLSRVLIAKELHQNMQNILAEKREVYRVEELMEVLYGASPLGGGRPKMLISYNTHTQELRTNDHTLHKGFSRALIKFDESYYNDQSIELTKLEYLYMSMTRDVGIHTADFILHEESGLHHLIVVRFDRDDHDHKIHCVTAAALLHKDITIPKVMSYEELFALTNYLCKSQAEIEELFRRMVFNTLGFNVDDHAKNFSFMMDRSGRWQLTPAYDITYSYGLVKEHLSTLNGKSHTFVLEDYLQLAQKNLIHRSKALEIIKETIGILETFAFRAKKIALSDSLIDECVQKITSQVALLKDV